MPKNEWGASQVMRSLDSEVSAPEFVAGKQTLHTTTSGNRRINIRPDDRNPAGFNWQPLDDYDRVGKHKIIFYSNCRSGTYRFKINSPHAVKPTNRTV